MKLFSRLFLTLFVLIALPVQSMLSLEKKEILQNLSLQETHKFLKTLHNNGLDHKKWLRNPKKITQETLGKTLDAVYEHKKKQFNKECTMLFTLNEKKISEIKVTKNSLKILPAISFCAYMNIVRDIDPYVLPSFMAFSMLIASIGIHDCNNELKKWNNLQSLKNDPSDYINTTEHMKKELNEQQIKSLKRLKTLKQDLDKLIELKQQQRTSIKTTDWYKVICNPIPGMGLQIVKK